MKPDEQQQHREEIIDQFSRQAIPFTRIPGHGDAIRLLMELSDVTSADEVLDVACGPGLVGCEFARRAKQVTGLDVTAAMIEQARRRQAEQGLANVEWRVGDACPLPFGDGTFSLVITRYSFHHFLDPERVLAEMIRVCRPGGRVLAADVALPAAKAAAYDRLERLRDPSHTHALTTDEFAALWRRSGLVACRESAYPVHLDLEAQLQASFPRPGDTERLRALVTADIRGDAFGINARREAGRVVYTCPITVLTGNKPVP